MKNTDDRFADTVKSIRKHFNHASLCNRSWSKAINTTSQAYAGDKGQRNLVSSYIHASICQYGWAQWKILNE